MAPLSLSRSFQCYRAEGQFEAHHPDSYLELHVNDAQERNARCPAQPNYVGLFSPTSADLHVYVIVLFGLVFLLLLVMTEQNPKSNSRDGLHKVGQKVRLHVEVLGLEVSHGNLLLLSSVSELTDLERMRLHKLYTGIHTIDLDTSKRVIASRCPIKKCFLSRFGLIFNLSSILFLRKNEVRLRKSLVLLFIFLNSFDW